MTASAPGTPATETFPRIRGNYDLIVAVFVAMLLISNVAATKLIQFGPEVLVGGFPVLPIITDGGAFLFPLTYVLGDVLAEVYGLRRAQRAIGVGFAMSALMSLTFWVVSLTPRPPTGRIRTPGSPCSASCPGSWWRAWPAILRGNS